MSNIILLAVILILVILSVLLIMNEKKKKQKSFENGICPYCLEKEVTIKIDNKTLKTPAITVKTIKNHGCSGVSDVEYSCSNCGIKEVFTISTHNACGL